MSNVITMKERNERNLVLPGDVVGDTRSIPGTGTKLVGDRLVAITAGLLQSMGEKVTVLPMAGAYDPRAGDLVVGIVEEANPGNWILNIRAPWLAPLHVSEAPWRVEFGETMQYLRPGDAVLCKVLFIDEQKKVQVTLKDRNLSKLEGGEIVEVPAVAVARVIGKNGSMVNLLKEYVECWMFVGQNGRIWLNGDPKEVQLAKEALDLIARESHLPGMTERVKAFLEKRKPGGVDAGLVVERSHVRRHEGAAVDAGAREPGTASEGRGGRSASGDGSEASHRGGNESSGDEPQGEPGGHEGRGAKNGRSKGEDRAPASKARRGDKPVGERSMED